MSLQKLIPKPHYLFGGALGAEIETRGLPAKLPFWGATANIKAPRAIKDIYQDYLEAGSEIVVTNTFWRVLEAEKAGISVEKQAAVNQAGIDLLYEVVKKNGKNIPIGGAVSPVEQCYSRQYTVTDISEIRRLHAPRINQFGASGKIDFVIGEVIGRIVEAEIIIELAQANNLPVWIAFGAEGENLLGGEKLTDAIKMAEAAGAEVIMVNCRTPEVLTESVQILAKNCSVPYGAYGNGQGAPGAENNIETSGWVSDLQYGAEIDEYLESVQKWIDLGCTFVGGCCGTNPEYYRAMRRLISTHKAN